MKKIFIILISVFFMKGFLMAVELKHLQINNTNIPVIYENSSQLPLFFIQIVFKGAGSVSDGKELGISNLTSSILNEGTKKLGVTKFSEKLEERALSLSVGSGFETMNFTLSGTKDEIDNALTLLNELLSNPNFTKTALNKVKENTIISILEKENDFDYQANKGLKEMIFKGTALQNTSIGTQKSIEAITLKDIESFYNSYINLENATIILGGDIKLDDISQKIQQTLKILPSGKKVEIANIQANDKQETKTIKKETQQAYIYFAAPLYVKDLEKESAILKVASFALGGSGFGSRMMEEIRVKRGLAYTAVLRLLPGKTYSYAHGYLQTSLKNEEEAKKLVSEVVDNFIKNGITQKELDAAKKYLLGSEPLRNETLSQRLSSTFRNYYDDLPLDFNSKVLKEIEKLSLKEVNDYIKEHKEIGKLTFSIVSAN